jgi:lipoprotein signal peptidase
LVGGLGSTNSAVKFNSANILSQWNLAEGILGRFLSLASYELPRFIGGNSGTRLAFIENNPWLAPFIIFLGLVGLLQPIALFVLWFRKDHTHKDWKEIRYLTLATILLLYASFAFSFRAPHSHTLYVTFPVVMLYSLYCWNEFLKQPRWRKFAMVFVVSGIIFSTGLAFDNFRRKSLYVDRTIPQAALDAKDYRILGERREGSRF